MGTKLSTDSPDLKNTPVVNVRGEKKSKFVGTLTGSKAVKSGFKNEDGSDKTQNVYEFVIKETDMDLLKKVGGEYIPADVEEGDTVCIFAPARLNNALVQAEKGMLLEITYLGLGKSGKKGGKPHMYDVEVL